MKRILLLLATAGIALTSHAASLPVVDFGDNLFWYSVGIPFYRAGVPGARTPERIKLAEGEFINGQPFSMDVPLNMMTGDYNLHGNSTRFYGGMKTHCWDNPSNKYAWSEGGCNVDHEGYDDLNYMGFALESLHTPEKPGCRQTAIGVWLWKKEHFLNGGDRHTVTFDDDSRVAVFLSRTYPVNKEHKDRLVAEGKTHKDAGPFTDTYANQQTNKVPREHWRGWESVHLVVQDGEQFYVAESGFEPAQQTLFSVQPTKVKWTKYNPAGPWDFEFNHNQAVFEPHTFTDVRAAGWMICKNTNENSTLWCKWYGFGMDAVVNRPAGEKSGWNLAMRPVPGADKLFMAATEVSYAQWRKVWKWGQRNQYCMHRSFSFDRDGNMGSMLADDREHTQTEPVTGMTWHDAVVWCNALSEYEGRTACYYTDAACTKVLRIARDGSSIEKSLIPPQVYLKPDADGYRLPTAPEWQLASAGSTAEPPSQGTRSVGSGSASPAGFHDLLGNVWEYIWDREGSLCDMAQDDARTVLGGDYRGTEAASALPYGERPSRGHYAIGFRPVRGSLQTIASKEAAQSIPSWTFLAKQVVPAQQADTTPAAPGIEMIAMEGFEGGKTEITYAQWKAVFAWSEVNGYHFGRDGDMGSMAWDLEPAAHDPSEPVTCVGLLDAAVWCNALSEMKGLKPCYYRDEAMTEPLRIADPFRVNSYQWAENSTRDGGHHKILPKFLFHLDEAANGYRLPMTAEWTAMCGGDYPSGARFNPATAWHADNSGDRTHPVGTMQPTGAGFHDLSGNVFEWCLARAAKPDPAKSLFFEQEARGGGFRSDDKFPKSLGKTPVRGAWNWISNGTAVPELGFRVVRTTTAAE